MQSQAGVPGVNRQPHLSDVIILHNEAELLREVMGRDNNFRGYANLIESILKVSENPVEDLRERVFDQMDPTAVQKSPEVRKSIQQFLQIFPKANTSVMIGNREFHTLLLGSVSTTLGYISGAASGGPIVDEEKLAPRLRDDLYNYVEKGEPFPITEKNFLYVLEFAEMNESQELIDACREFIDKKTDFLEKLPNDKKADLLDFATTRHQGWLQIRLLKIDSFTQDKKVLAQFKKERPHLHQLCQIAATHDLNYSESTLIMHVFNETRFAQLAELIVHQLHIDNILLSTNDLVVVQDTCDLINLSSDIKTFLFSPRQTQANEQLDVVSNMLRSNKTLISFAGISFAGGAIETSNPAIQNLASALSENSTLKDISLGHMSFSEEGAIALAKALKQNKGLEGLSFRNSYLTPAGVEAIIAILGELPQLSTLDLSGNNIGLKAINLLAAALEKHPGITSLDLSNNQINDECAARLSVTLEKDRGLEELILKKNQITASGIKILADALATNQTLVKLNLSKNPFGPEGARHLAAALQKNKFLRELYMAHAGIQNDGASHLEEVLRQNSSLKTLDLESNEINIVAAAKLLEALRDNKALSKLFIKSDFIDREDFEHLSTLIINPNLTIPLRSDDW